MPEPIVDPRDCTACALHQSCRRPVPGEFWVDPRRLWGLQGMIVGEAPGRDEDAQGHPFVGKTGRELDRLLQMVTRVPRERWYITNIVKCRPPKNRDPEANEVAICSRWILEELGLVEPALLVTVGRYATRFFLGDVDMENVHGIPQQAVDYPNTMVFPVIHPAAGFHNQQNLARIQEDFFKLGECVRSQSGPVYDQCAGNEDYLWVEDPDTVARYLSGAAEPIFGVDTESVRETEPWSIQISTGPGHAILIPESAAEAVQVASDYLCRPGTTIVLQNALHDLPVMKLMGIEPGPEVQVPDTMLMAYLLQTEPQGLKPLAFRHAGMQMDPYTDVVRAATHYKAMHYLARVLDRHAADPWPDPEPQLVWDGDIPKIKQPQNIAKKVARILNDEFTRAGTDKAVDAYQRWRNIEESEGRGMVEAEFGPLEPGYLSDVDRETATWYACRDADATLRIYHPLKERLSAWGLEESFRWDLGAMQMVLDMMEAGIQINPETMQELAGYFRWRAEAVEEEAQEWAEPGGHVSLGSPLQVGKWLFEDLGLDKAATRKTKTGWATGDEVLSRIENDHPAVGMVKTFRQYSKLAGTYAETIPRKAEADGRVRCKIRITSTATGRLSTSDPNLMAIPTRTLEGKQIRTGFVARPGCVITTSDYSQIEMRSAADLGDDAEMLRCFREGLDIHTQTAMRIFGVAESAVDKMKHRYPCKRIGFGVLYGITGEGLWKQLYIAGLTDWTVADCDRLIQEWFGVYSGIRQFMRDTVLHARRYGYVRDRWGRIRLTPGVSSSDKWTRLEAEREACNAPVQMTAAGVAKKAMHDLVPVYREWRRRGVWINPLLQIHDDLLFEVPVEHAKAFLLGSVVPTMESAVRMKIPTPVDPEIGWNWGEQMPIEKFEEKYGLNLPEAEAAA